MTPWTYPTLLADVGGTRIRFTIAESGHAAPGEVEVMRSADFRSLTQAAQAYLALVGRDGRAGQPPAPASAALAVATPVQAVRSRPVKLTNIDFTIDAADLLASLRLASLWIVNDFEALAWSLPTLKAHELTVIGSASPSRDATMAVIGPGTGMGCAGLLGNAAGWHAIPGEGGHVTLSARTAYEREVLAAAADQMDHVSAEKLLSGRGLPLLYRAVATVRGDDAATRPLPTAREITTRADAGDDPLCNAVVDTFCALLGGYAGNVALTFGAVGGVVIGGGVAAHLRERLARSEFRSRFEDKGRFADYLRPVGTALITRAQPALDGLVFALTNSLASLPVLHAQAPSPVPPAGTTNTTAAG